MLEEVTFTFDPATDHTSIFISLEIMLYPTISQTCIMHKSSVKHRRKGTQSQVVEGQGVGWAAWQWLQTDMAHRHMEQSIVSNCIRMALFLQGHELFQVLNLPASTTSSGLKS